MQKYIVKKIGRYLVYIRVIDEKNYREGDQRPSNVRILL